MLRLGLGWVVFSILVLLQIAPPVSRLSAFIKSNLLVSQPSLSFQLCLSLKIEISWCRD
jgi:hypothetical protein